MARSIVSAVRVPSLRVLAALLLALGLGAAATAEPVKIGLKSLPKAAE